MENRFQHPLYRWVGWVSWEGAERGSIAGDAKEREESENGAVERAREGNIPLMAGEKRLMKKLHRGPQR